ncbi:MAG: alpha/beta hydrolase, partial [Proteocatella sp.]|nr:alpha/beta hydrolase [Proteocatella sp.]
MKIVEGYMPYLEYKTYYRIIGEQKDGRKPLVLLH